MAALQSSTEGHPSKPPSRSFLDILTSQTAGILQPRSSTSYRGFPSIAFSADEISKFSAPFLHALIGKFSSGRPPMESIRRAFISIGFAGTYSIGLIDFRHILIKFNIEEDYVRAFLKRIYTIDGFTMRLFKWSPDFSVDSESAIVPIWINFPLLPLHFFNKEALYNIARLIGEPLKMDASTAALTRPSVARVCVELDLRKVRPEKIWLVNGDNGFWQPVDYEKLPPLCSTCLKIGHQTEACRSVDSRPTPPTAVERPTQKMRLEYRPKIASVPNLNAYADKEKYISIPHPLKPVVNQNRSDHISVEVAATDLMKFKASSSTSADTVPADLSVPNIFVGTSAAQRDSDLLPSVNSPALDKTSTVAAAVQNGEAKASCSTVEVSLFDLCLSAPSPIMDMYPSVPPDLLAFFPFNVANTPTANSRNLDSVAYPPDLFDVCQSNVSASPLDSTSHMFFNGIQRPMSDEFDSDPNVKLAVTMDSSEAVVADVAKVPLVTDSVPISVGALNPNAPIFNPQSHPFAWLSKSFAAALLGETRPLNVSEVPLFFAVKSAEFPTFQMPQFAEHYTSSSFIPPDETTSSFPRDDIYTFSDGDDVPRWTESRGLILASLKSFYKNLQAKFSMHSRFFRCPKHRKKWKQRAPISTTDPALSSNVHPPLNALTFHGPNPYAVQPEDNDSVEYESEWHTESSDEENSFDFSIPLSSEAALMALEYEDFSLSPPRRRKYNKRFRDLPPPLPTRRTQPKD